MAQKQGQESQSGYMDGTHVKISERYKPPPRINPVITYAQRLLLNKQLLDNMLDYDFNREQGVLGKMTELKCARKAVSEECRLRSEKVRSERRKRQEERDTLEAKQAEEEEVRAESISKNNLNTSTTTATTFSNQPTGNLYSNILTPIPLTEALNQTYSCKPSDKSPFNISDFEADTSSPFDNMELKTLNDMEELAQVLKSETKTSGYHHTYDPVQSNSSNYSNYLGQYHVPFSISTSYSHQPNVPPVYSNTNGYYYAADTNQSFVPNTSYLLNSTPNHEHMPILPPPTTQDSKTSFRSVPDIMKALEEELESTQLEDNTTPNNNQPSRPKSTDAVYPKVMTKTTDLGNPFNLLSEELQELSKNISSMGFPLPRVARACEHLGPDHKKVVEHLLAMSELMDLGFPEKEVSVALLQCGNDRDKALDKLIL